MFAFIFANDRRLLTTMFDQSARGNVCLWVEIQNATVPDFTFSRVSTPCSALLAFVRAMLFAMGLHLFFGDETVCVGIYLVEMFGQPR